VRSSLTPFDETRIGQLAAMAMTQTMSAFGMPLSAASTFRRDHFDGRIALSLADALEKSALAEDGVKVSQDFRRVPLLESDEFSGDLAVAVDDVGLGVHRCSVRLGDG
jgi:hypothetical protein